MTGPATAELERDTDPLATLATPGGRGAVATILIAAPDACNIVNTRFRAASGRMLDDLPAGGVSFGFWQHDANETAEEIVVACTGDILEIHCHGGSFAARSILTSLASLGCQVVPWAEWLRRRTSVFQEEAARALAAATTRRVALLLLAQTAQGDQSAGALSREIGKVSRLIADGHTRQEGLSRLRRLIASSEVGLRLVEPWRVVIAGAPNVGKSSLINSLAGFERSIVFDQPGTTRDAVETVVALEGWPIQLIDTAGLRATLDTIERTGVERTHACLARADLAILVRDVNSSMASPSPQELLDACPRVLTVMNKIDLRAEPRKGESSSGPELYTSAVTGEGLDALRSRIVETLIPRPPNIGSPLIFSQRQLESARRAESLAIQNQVQRAIDQLKTITS